MSKNICVTVAIDKNYKDAAEAVLVEKGLTIEDVMRLAVIRVAKEGDFPTEGAYLNQTTVQAMEDGITGNGVSTIASIGDLIEGK